VQLLATLHLQRTAQSRAIAEDLGPDGNIKRIHIDISGGTDTNVNLASDLDVNYMSTGSHPRAVSIIDTAAGDLELNSEATISSSGDRSRAIVIRKTGDNGAGNVTVNLKGGSVTATGMNSHAIIAESPDDAYLRVYNGATVTGNVRLTSTGAGTTSRLAFHGGGNSDEEAVFDGMVSSANSIEVMNGARVRIAGLGTPTGGNMST